MATTHHRCSHYTGRQRCTLDAVGRLVHPDGTYNPGGFVCWDHGTAPLVEYAKKLRELWHCEPLELRA